MQSGTGVYYQAMPAVGPGGKSVMKLIPVRKVNGHFVQTQVLPSRNLSQPAHTSPVPLPQSRIPTVQPTADGRFILKTPLELNTVYNPVKSQNQGSNVLLQSSSNQVHVPVFPQNVAQNAMPSPVHPSNKAVIITKRTPLPNTVKPPTLASGHYLQIPSDATVKTLPASALPSAIKNRICHSTNDSNPVNGLPVVLYVSPVSALKLDQQAPGLTKPTEPSQTVGHTSALGVVKSVKESPKKNQGGTTPMKWVVEERAGSSAPYLIPVTSPSMSSDILKAVKHMESSKIPNQVANETVSADNHKETFTSGNDNALVMCNGQVYFMAKKNVDVSKDMINKTENKPPPRQSAPSPTSTTTLGTVTSSVSQKQDSKSPIDNKKPSDIIDLCDDDEESSASISGRIIMPADAVSEHDEDSNVIFVSYIPPKSLETETSIEVPRTTSPTSCVKDTANTESTESMETGEELNSTINTELDASKCEAEHVNRPAPEGNEALPETVESGQQTDVTKKCFEETLPDQTPQPKSDSELRRTFGITCDLRVSLQKTDLSKVSQPQECCPQDEKRLINKRTLDGIRKLIRDSKIETKIQQLVQAQVSTPVKTGKRKRLERSGDNDGLDTCPLIDAHSSPLSNVVIESANEIQSSSEQSTDRQVFQTCQSTEKETPSRNGTEGSDMNTSPVCSSLINPVEPHTNKCQSDSPNCSSGLRKTPPRSSKGCGKVCTACPCGTKVGGVAGNPALIPREKPNSPPSINSSKSVSGESDKNVATVDSLENLVSSLTNDNSASGRSRNETTHGSKLHVSKDVKGTSPTAQLPTSQPEAQPTETCSSSSRCTQDKTNDKSASSQLETHTQTPNKLNEVKVILPSSRQLYYTSYKLPSELYSSVQLDPEEIKRQERIRHLKNLLQEKEAVLEKLRKSM